MAADLLIRPRDKVRWMWADAGISPTRCIAFHNPLRWSKAQSPKDTLSELEKNKDSNRPVTLYVEPSGGVLRSIVLEFKSGAAAAEALKGQPIDEIASFAHVPKPVALALGHETLLAMKTAEKIASDMGLELHVSAPPFNVQTSLMLFADSKSQSWPVVAGQDGTSVQSGKDRYAASVVANREKEKPEGFTPYNPATTTFWNVPNIPGTIGILLLKIVTEPNFVAFMKSKGAKEVDEILHLDVAKVPISKITQDTQHPEDNDLGFFKKDSWAKPHAETNYTLQQAYDMLQEHQQLAKQGQFNVDDFERERAKIFGTRVPDLALGAITTKHWKGAEYGFKLDKYEVKEEEKAKQAVVNKEKELKAFWEKQKTEGSSEKLEKDIADAEKAVAKAKEELDLTKHEKTTSTTKETEFRSLEDAEKFERELVDSGKVEGCIVECVKSEDGARYESVMRKTTDDQYAKTAKFFKIVYISRYMDAEKSRKIVATTTQTTKYNKAKINSTWFGKAFQPQMVGCLSDVITFIAILSGDISHSKFEINGGNAANLQALLEKFYKMLQEKDGQALKEFVNNFPSAIAHDGELDDWLTIYMAEYVRQLVNETISDEVGKIQKFVTVHQITMAEHMPKKFIDKANMTADETVRTNIARPLLSMWPGNNEPTADVDENGKTVEYWGGREKMAELVGNPAKHGYQANTKYTFESVAAQENPLDWYISDPDAKNSQDLDKISWNAQNLPRLCAPWVKGRAGI